MTKNLELAQVRQAVEKLHAGKLVGLESRDFSYLKKLSGKEAFQDGYSFALRDVLIALNALAFPSPKKAHVTVTDEAFRIDENGKVTYCELALNPDGTAWGLYPRKNREDEEGSEFLDWRGARNILILSSMGKIKLETFQDPNEQKKPVKEEKTPEQIKKTENP